MKNILCAVAVVLFALMGAVQDASAVVASGPGGSLALGEQEIKVVHGAIAHPGHGPSHVLMRAGCNIGWLSWTMEQSNIPLEDLPKLPLGREVIYPADCALPPPADIVADSERIYAYERARLKEVRAARRALLTDSGTGVISGTFEPLGSSPVEDVKRAALRARNIELERLNSDLLARLVAVEAAKGEAPAPASQLASELKVTMDKLKIADEKAEKAEERASNAELALVTMTEERDRLWGELEQARAERTEGVPFFPIVATIVLGGIFVWLFTYLYYTSDVVRGRMWSEVRREVREEVRGDVRKELEAEMRVTVSSGGNGEDNTSSFSPYYPIRFDGVMEQCPASVKWPGKNTRPIITLSCPNDGCPAMGIEVYNIKKHLVDCRYGKGRRGLREVPSAAS